MRKLSTVLSTQKCLTAIKESELVLVDTPRIEVVSADKENGVEFKAICITKPEITVADYKGIKAPKNVKDITDADIDAQIEQTSREMQELFLSMTDRRCFRTRLL